MNERRAVAPAPVVASVGDVEPAPGDHVCALYRGRAERDRLIAHASAGGLHDGHMRSNATPWLRSRPQVGCACATWSCSA